MTVIHIIIVRPFTLSKNVIKKDRLNYVPVVSAKNNMDQHAEASLIMKLPINKSKPIHGFVIVIRLTKTQCISRSRPCGSTCDKLTGCKRVLAIEAKKKGYIIDFVIYSDIDENGNRIMVKETLTELITTFDNYESKGSIYKKDCLIS